MGSSPRSGEEKRELTGLDRWNNGSIQQRLQCFKKSQEKKEENLQENQLNDETKKRFKPSSRDLPAIEAR